MLSHGFLLHGSATRTARAIGYIAGHMGGTGVALFFAISGFLITTLLLEELDRNGRISLPGFYIRRALRILPPAYLYLTVLALASSFGWLGDSLRRGELASAAFFYSNYWGDRSWYTAHFWSLSMEEHFYLLWPSLLAALGVRRALFAAGVLIAATMLWRPWSLVQMAQLPYPLLQRTDTRLDAFLFSCSLAVMLHGPYRAPLLKILCATWFRVVSVGCLIIVWSWTLVRSAPATGTLVESALLPCMLASLIYWPESALFRVLESLPLCWTGKISYGLYLWQQFFLRGSSADNLRGALVDFLPGIALTFLAAALSYYALERPLLAYGRALSLRLQTRLLEFSSELEPSSIMEQ
jgi:peptidoglycan/LPS O-acetylase OafA/YrhL